MPQRKSRQRPLSGERLVEKQPRCCCLTDGVTLSKMAGCVRYLPPGGFLHLALLLLSHRFIGVGSSSGTSPGWRFFFFFSHFPLYLWRCQINSPANKGTLVALPAHPQARPQSQAELAQVQVDPGRWIEAWQGGEPLVASELLEPPLPALIPRQPPPRSFPSLPRSSHLPTPFPPASDPLPGSRRFSCAAAKCSGAVKMATSSALCMRQKPFCSHSRAVFLGHKSLRAPVQPCSGLGC